MGSHDGLKFRKGSRFSLVPTSYLYAITTKDMRILILKTGFPKTSKNKPKTVGADAHPAPSWVIENSNGQSKSATLPQGFRHLQLPQKQHNRKIFRYPIRTRSSGLSSSSRKVHNRGWYSTYDISVLY